MDRSADIPIGWWGDRRVSERNLQIQILTRAFRGCLVVQPGSSHQASDFNCLWPGWLAWQATAWEAAILTGFLEYMSRGMYVCNDLRIQHCAVCYRQDSPVYPTLGTE